MKRIFKSILIFLCFTFLIFIGLVLLFPEPQNFHVQSESSKIYDRHATLLYEILLPEKGKQDFISLDEVSSHFIDAIIAVEDQGFYEHNGVDFLALIRAFWQNTYYGEVVSGASTIEQQLIRNLLEHHERNLKNKFGEMILAFKFNLKYSKEELLEKYINTIYFGNLAYGIEAASQTYFGKNASQLNLAESSYLAALPQAPSRYNPYANLQLGLNRQKQVLENLHKQGKITHSQLDVAQAEELQFKTQKLVDIQAPHFVMWLLSELEKKGTLADITLGGETIQTTLDLGLQKEIQNLVNLHLDQLKTKNITNASVVVIDQTSGEILAMFGSRDYFDEEIDGEVNIATSLRQPGSTLKPFLYALAFEKGFSPASKITDEPIQFQTADGHPYEPKNYDLQYHGEVTLREALSQSLNIPAVKILDFISVRSFLNNLQKLGIQTLHNSSDYYGLALALGSGEVTLLEITRAYGILGNLGQELQVSPFLNQAQSTQSLIPSKIVSQITDILSDNFARIPAFGEDSALNFNYPVAVKTGTSRNFRDNWTFGYTPLRTVGVWVGNSDASAMINSSGVTGAAPLFHSVMDLVMQGLPKPAFQSIDSSKAEFIPDFDTFVKENSLSQSSQSETIILYPFSGDVFKISDNLPLANQTLKFKAETAGDWILNGENLGKGKTLEWQLKRGEHQLQYSNELEEQIISFEVL